jgi:hypothetical protein
LRDFLAAFFPDEEEKIYLRAFKAKAAPNAPNNRPLVKEVTRRQLATDANLQELMLSANRTRGWYFVVNSGGNADDDITRFNAFFVECDSLTIAEQHAQLDSSPLPPSIRVETRKSVHAYFLIEGACDEATWREMQERLIDRFAGDKSIKNPSRVMRLPFFEHVSYDETSQAHAFKRVELVEFAPERRYTLAQMQAAFPASESHQQANEATQPEAHGLDFTTWNGLHGEVVRRIQALPTARTGSSGWLHAKAVCHDGKGHSALCVSPEGAYSCKDGCTSEQIRLALGLPARPSEIYSSTPEGEEECLGLAQPFDLFLSKSFEAGETVCFELYKCELGMILSVTNAGKSSLLRNAAITLACGGEFLPFVKKGEPQKVWLIDFESSAFRLQQDLRRMSRILTPEELSLINENLHITSEATVGDAMLSMSQHLSRIELEAKAVGFSVIIIDTVSAGFDFFNENDNAEISRRALKPLLAMARKLNCLIIIAHHVGKAKLEGGEASERVHRGRGASAFAQYAGAIFEIQPDSSDKDAVKLYCSKRKNGEPYEVVLKLNREDRWFSCLTQLQRTPTNYELVVEYVTKQDQPVKTAQVQAGLSDKVSRSTVTRHLDSAVQRGDLEKLARGEYAAPDEKAQKLTPISDEPLSLPPETQFVEGVL